MSMSSDNHHAVLMATLRSAGPSPPEPDRIPAPWEANLRATCECLAWRGALGNLERRRAEDKLGATTYADFPLHARAAVVTAHSLLERGAIAEHELEAKMNQVRARFQKA
jgi:Nitrile hydratase beta subunit